MAGAEIALELAPEQRQRTVWRIDGGGGSDDHLRWLLSRGYHIVAKGMNNRRAVALARQVRRWDSYGPSAWLGALDSRACEASEAIRVLRAQDAEEARSMAMAIPLTVPVRACWKKSPKTS